MKNGTVLQLTKSTSFFVVMLFFLLNACSTTTNEKQALRAPAYPLITVDPYTSLWSMSDTLYNDAVRHWTGTRQGLIGALRVDGQVYRFLGKEELPLNVVIGMADNEAWKCRYTLEEPSENWDSIEFDDSKWKQGVGAFGTDDAALANTIWETEHIWVRREFTFDSTLSNAPLFLKYSHDDDLDLYLNGKKIIATGNACYKEVILPLDGELKTLINRNGKNVIAAHCFNRVGLAYLDFGIMQAKDNGEIFEKTAVQKSVELTATQSKYIFSCGPVDLKLTFTSPLLPAEPDLLSRPVNYISYEVSSSDAVEHDVEIYFEATPEHAVDELSQKVTVSKGEIDGLKYLKAGTVEQNVLGKKGDNRRIDWGYFYLCSPAVDNFNSSIGNYNDVKKEFIASGKVTPVIEKMEDISMLEMMPVMALTQTFGKVNSEQVTGYVMVAYDDLYSIQYFNTNLQAWWKQGGQIKIEDALRTAALSYEEVIEKCGLFDAKLYEEAVTSGGSEYAELCILAFRQSIAAHKLVKDENGEILFLSKENFSNGSIGTVDVTYPSAPLYLYYNPDLLKGMLNAIFNYSEKAGWTKPFAPHDVGTYPLANGQTYGGDMPVEESGNMLILTTAIAQMEGNAAYAESHWETLTKWADYLLEKGLDPENQLCTDDFAGHFAHNTNLSVKAIMGIAGYGKLAAMLDKKDIAEKYLSNAKEMAEKWAEMAVDSGHFKLTFDQAGTWSQKYNLVWDEMLDLNIFDPEITKKEIAYYLTKQNAYGLPLDNRRTYTKSDWVIWTASLAGDKETFGKFITPLYKFVNETPDRIPMTDWYETIDARHVGFQARSVVGGYFVKMLKDKIVQDKK